MVNIIKENKPSNINKSHNSIMKMPTLTWVMFKMTNKRSNSDVEISKDLISVEWEQLVDSVDSKELISTENISTDLISVEWVQLVDSVDSKEVILKENISVEWEDSEDCTTTTTISADMDTETKIDNHEND